MLPLSAACLVASAVRETLTGLFGEAVSLRLFEPVIPTPEAWRAIAADATIYRVRSSSADAAIIVRPRDAAVLAAAAFGECDARSDVLSVLERTVLERTVRAIAAQFAPLCGAGTLETTIQSDRDVAGFVTFFELSIDGPARARIGVALSRDPVPEAKPEITIEDLFGLPVELAVRIDAGVHPAAVLGSLEPGDVLWLPGGTPRGTLRAAGRPLAAGECGVHGRYYALALDRTLTGRDEPV
ncbi:MAG TPA: hypothetical protein VMD47_02320 [Candidatus Acidoferrales bacterium]|nr:hypothetical protein [Candidatus Acidoferrales bacterium]